MTGFDNNGNLLSDVTHTYSWDAENKLTAVDTVSLTFDALGRMVEQATGSSYTQIVYSPSGYKLALMNGQTLQKAFCPLPGGATAVYGSSGTIAYYRHSDWLGSSRFASTPSRTKYFDVAYAPYGEDYADSGTTDLDFTGQNQDTVSGLYDFLYREYHPNSGRWIQPDPAALAAANPANPQSWNRYTYVSNNSLVAVDPLGLFKDDVYGHGDGCFEASACTTYYVDGRQVPGTVAQSLLSMGAAGQAPNNTRSGSLGGHPYNITGWDEDSWQLFGIKPCYTSAGGRSVCGWEAYAEFMGDTTFLKYLPTKMWQPFMEAFNFAMSKVNHNQRCRDFFGGHGAAALQAEQYEGVDLGAGGVGAATYSGRTFINSNPGGGFLSPPSSFLGATGIMQVNALELMHELGHRLDILFSPDSSLPNGQPNPLNRINSTIVDTNCMH